MIRVALVVDTLVYRDGLSQLLLPNAHAEIVGAFSANHAALEAMAELTPEVVLLDSHVAGGPDFCRTLHQLVPASRLVLLGVDGDLDRLARWAEAGVSGFVTQDRAIQELETAIVVAARGDFVYPRNLIGQLIGHIARSIEPRAQLPLTAREIEIAAYLERGFTNKEIATHLGIEVATTKNHVHNILEKLQVSRRSEAASVYRRSITPGASSPASL